MKFLSNGARKRLLRARVKSRGKRAGGAYSNLAGAIFPKLSKPENRYGVAVMLALAHRQGGEAELLFSRIEQAGAYPGRRPKQSLFDRIDRSALARFLAGLAHADRLRIAGCILTGSNTHQLLAKSLGLKTGPLYHHLRELERAGVVDIASRNLYTLTETGETLLLLLCGLNLTQERKLGAWRREKARSLVTRKRRSAA